MVTSEGEVVQKRRSSEEAPLISPAEGASPRRYRHREKFFNRPISQLAMLR
jgi:hypothetical protein